MKSATVSQLPGAILYDCQYQAIFYVIFTLMGQFVEMEVRSTRGRADAVVKTQNVIYACEFKLNGTAEEALKQIDDFLYAGRKAVL